MQDYWAGRLPTWWPAVRRVSYYVYGSLLSVWPMASCTARESMPDPALVPTQSVILQPYPFSVLLYNNPGLEGAYYDAKYAVAYTRDLAMGGFQDNACTAVDAWGNFLRVVTIWPCCFVFAALLGLVLMVTPSAPLPLSAVRIEVQKSGDLVARAAAGSTAAAAEPADMRWAHATGNGTPRAVGESRVHAEDTAPRAAGGENHLPPPGAAQRAWSRVSGAFCCCLGATDRGFMTVCQLIESAAVFMVSDVIKPFVAWLIGYSRLILLTLWIVALYLGTASVAYALLQVRAKAPSLHPMHVGLQHAWPHVQSTWQAKKHFSPPCMLVQCTDCPP